jgi:hypothetical protein
VKITSKYDTPAYETLLNAERGGTSMGFKDLVSLAAEENTRHYVEG